MAQQQSAEAEMLSRAVEAMQSALRKMHEMENGHVQLLSRIEKCETQIRKSFPVYYATVICEDGTFIYREFNVAGGSFNSNSQYQNQQQYSSQYPNQQYSQYPNQQQPSPASDWPHRIPKGTTIAVRGVPGVIDGGWVIAIFEKNSIVGSSPNQYILGGVVEFYIRLSHLSTPTQHCGSYHAEHRWFARTLGCLSDAAEQHALTIPLRGVGAVIGTSASGIDPDEFNERFVGRSSSSSQTKSTQRTSKGDKNSSSKNKSTSSRHNNKSTTTTTPSVVAPLNKLKPTPAAKTIPKQEDDFAEESSEPPQRSSLVFRILKCFIVCCCCCFKPNSSADDDEYDSAEDEGYNSPGEDSSN